MSQEKSAERKKKEREEFVGYLKKEGQATVYELKKRYSLFDCSSISIAKYFKGSDKVEEAKKITNENGRPRILWEYVGD